MSVVNVHIDYACVYASVFALRGKIQARLAYFLVWKQRVQLSEKTKNCCEISQPVYLLCSSVSFGQSEPFGDCGFVSLLWLQRIMQHRPCSQCESFFSASACVHVCARGPPCTCSYQKWNFKLVFEKSLVGSHIAPERMPYCVTPLASSLRSLPLVTLAEASTYCVL